MRALPTMEYPDKEGVTLKCTRVQEAVSDWILWRGIDVFLSSKRVLL